MRKITKLLFSIIFPLLILACIFPMGLATPPDNRPPNKVPKTIIINNDITYDITENIANYYNYTTIDNETIIWNIDNRTFTTINNIDNRTIINNNVEYKTVNEYFTNNYNIDLTPILNEIHVLKLKIATLDRKVDWLTLAVILEGLGLMALSGAIVKHLYFGRHHRHPVAKPQIVHKSYGKKRYSIEEISD